MDLATELPLKEILDNFGFEGKYLNHTTFGKGHIHDTFKFLFELEDSSHRTYLLQKINTQVFQKPLAVMQNILLVSAHLGQKYRDLPDKHRRFLKLIPLKDNRHFYQDQQKQYWRAYDFIQDTYSPDFVESPEQAYQAARAFATFVRDLMDCDVEQFQETIPNFHHLGKRFENFERALENADSKRMESANEAIRSAQKRKYLVDEVHKILPQLPIRIVHNDTKVNNVLLDNQSGEGLCVVDLDTVMPGYLLYDFGDLIRTSISPVAEDHPNVAQVELRMPILEAISKGYLEILGDLMHPLEKKYLFLGAKLMTYIMAIRFLTDYLAGDMYYKISHPLHNLDRAMNQLRLLEILENQEDLINL